METVGVTAGIDVGTRFVKIALMKEGTLVGDSVCEWGETRASLDAWAREELMAILEQARIDPGQVTRILATGAGAAALSFAHGMVEEELCCARGTTHYVPSARTIVDAGYAGTRALVWDGQGKITTRRRMQWMAWEARAFIEAMTRPPDVSVDGVVKLVFGTRRGMDGIWPYPRAGAEDAPGRQGKRAPVGEEMTELSRSVAQMAASLLQDLGAEEDLVLVGGLAHNAAFVDAFREIVYEQFGVDQVRTPENPILAPALGAALHGAGTGDPVTTFTR